TNYSWVTGGLCLSQVSLGIKAGYTLDRVPTHHRAHTHNLEMLINLQCMSLDWGRNPEYPEETPEARGEHANSTHTAEAGIKPPTLEEQVIVSTPCDQVLHLCPVGCLIVVTDEANHCGVDCKLDDGVGSIHRPAVVGEEGVEERAQHTALWYVRTLRCICVVWGIGSNLEYHITLEGWNFFLILSCLSVFTTRVEAHKEQSLRELQLVLNNMTPWINVSTASLYAPLPDVNNCTKKLMYCYLLELNVLLHEEEHNRKEDFIHTIYVIKKDYNFINENCSTCLACEAHPLANSTTFSARMQEFLQKLLSKLPYDPNNCE
ncbi:hypothetical protein QTP70_022596, partial [Hemibagrus guttatus]